MLVTSVRRALLVAFLGPALVVEGVALVSVAAALVIGRIFALQTAFVVIDVRP